MNSVGTLFDIANSLINEDLTMEYFETFTLQQLSFIYKKRIDSFAIGDEGDDFVTGEEEYEMLIGSADQSLVKTISQQALPST